MIYPYNQLASKPTDSDLHDIRYHESPNTMSQQILRQKKNNNNNKKNVWEHGLF